MSSDPDPVTAGPSSSTGHSRPGGLVLQPFRALRYAVPASQLPETTSAPYDVGDGAGVAALESLSASNTVRLILPRATPGTPAPYATAAQAMQTWRREGVLQLDPEPALYVYEQSGGPTDHVQRGLLGALQLSPPQDGVVLPHEDTTPGPVADRLALYDAVQADLEPVFLLYDGDRGAASRAVTDAVSTPPLVDAVLADGLRHRLWALTDPGLLAAVAADLLPRTALVADGHHRYATYLQRQARQRAGGAGQGPWDLGLVYLVDASAFGPAVHAIHRVVPGVEAAVLAARAATGAVVHDLDGNDLDDALLALQQAGASGAAFLLASGDGGTLRLVTDLDPERLDRALPSERSLAWRALDVAALHHYVVPELWGLEAGPVVPEADVHGALALAATSGGTAVLLNPTSVEAVRQVAAEGERMPRKSTMFVPKPRSGLLVRPYDA